MSILTNLEKIDRLQAYGESDTELVRVRQEMREMIDHRNDPTPEAKSGGDMDPARAGDPSFQQSSSVG